MMLGECNRVLVIAPLNVARTVWAEEAKKWDHTRHLTCVKALGDALERTNAIEAGADITIINRENVDWLVKTLLKRKPGKRGKPLWPWDMLVIDELSSFKSRAAARWKALVKALPAVRRVVGLTGTPAPNGLIDLWPQMYLLDEGARLGRTLGAYREQYFTPGARNNRLVYDWRPRPGAAKAIQEKISDICVSMDSADWLTMPERLERVIDVELEPAALEAYHAMEKEMVLTLPDGEDITAANAAVVGGKLLQMSGGALYDDLGVPREISHAKLDALRETVEAAQGPVLIFYGYRHELPRLMDAIPDARPLKEALDVEHWNAGKLPALLAHPASAGHGLNLQAGGHTVVWYSLPWSLELYQQANARLWRRGQTKTVIIHHLLAKGTIDHVVYGALAGKDARQGALLEAVKALREDVLRGSG